MADPISTASGILTLVVFAFKSSKLLYDAVSSFQSNQRTVRELREELEALDGVLESLQDTATKTDADLTTLELPLLRCGKACKDFEAVITKCTARSGGPRTSFRDWAKLKYMGDDMAGFKNMLAGYKSTIIIALGNTNMRTNTVTVNFLKEFKEMVANTTSDLNDHLQEIDNKLQMLSLQGAEISDEDAAERQRIQEERESTQQCLSICNKVYTHLDQVQPKGFENVATPPDTFQNSVNTLGSLTSARLVTAESFKTCKETIAETTTRLEKHLRDIDNRLKSFPSQRIKLSNEQTAEREIMLEEIDSIKQCLAICAQGSKQADQDRTNIFEDVSMADDGQQLIVSTVGDLISAKRITVGARSLQLMGQMSDSALQQVSTDHRYGAAEKAKESQTATGTQFKGRYGEGVKLSSRDPKDVGAGPSNTHDPGDP